MPDLAPVTLARVKLDDDVIKRKHFPRYWPFVRGIHRPQVNSPHKGQWRGALMFSVICPWINGWVNNRNAGDLRCHSAHYDVIAMSYLSVFLGFFWISYRRSTNWLFLDIISAFNKLRPEQSGWHSRDDIFKCVFLKKKSFWINLSHQKKYRRTFFKYQGKSWFLKKEILMFPPYLCSYWHAISGLWAVFIHYIQ